METDDTKPTEEIEASTPRPVEPPAQLLSFREWMQHHQERRIEVKLSRALIIPIWAPRAVEPGQVYVIRNVSGERIRWQVKELVSSSPATALLFGQVFGQVYEIRVPITVFTDPTVRLAERC